MQHQSTNFVLFSIFPSYVSLISFSTFSFSSLFVKQRIESATVQQKCFSLTYFLQHISALKVKEAKAIENVNESIDPSGACDDDDASCTSINSLCTYNTVATNVSTMNISQNPNIQLRNNKHNIADTRTVTTTRFLPLIIDEEHAERALPLLQEELLRLDR